jgi:hypothetical protein
MRVSLFASLSLAMIGGGMLASTQSASAGLDFYDVTTVFVGEDGYGGGGNDIEYYGASGGIGAWAVGTTACNEGNIVAPWYGGTTDVPVIAQNIYRYKSGRFEQIGVSWLKHSFCAVSEPGCGTCQSTGCNTLGIGCADTYWADLNANVDAPRSEINATTGEYAYPFSIAPSGPSTIRARIQVLPADIEPSQNSGAQYWIEGQYVEPGESVWDVQNNNASCRAVRFTSSTNCTGLSPTQFRVPAVTRWAQVDPNATVVEVFTDETGQGGEGIANGLLHFGNAVSSNSDGSHHYEYLIHNQTSHRSVGSFSIPVPECVEISNVEVRMPQYHSGETIENTPWTYERSGGMLTFSTPAHTSANNFTGPAIRWGTLVNFRFDSDAAPGEASGSLGLWRSGPGDSSYALSLGAPSCEDDPCPSDLNDDGVVNVDDLLLVVGGYGTPDGDVNGDGVGDVNDILLVIEDYGNNC